MILIQSYHGNIKYKNKFFCERLSHMKSYCEMTSDHVADKYAVFISNNIIITSWVISFLVEMEDSWRQYYFVKIFKVHETSMQTKKWQNLLFLPLVQPTIRCFELGFNRCFCESQGFSLRMTLLLDICWLLLPIKQV